MMAAVTFVSCGQKNPEQVTALLNRIGGEGTSARIETQVKRSLSKDGKDVFEISVKDGKPYIQGSSMSALITGIGWYLNHYVHVNLAWNNLTTDLSEVTLPVPAEKERRECSADYRYYLNYCTYSYSMAFWTQERWEQEIDWMEWNARTLITVWGAERTAENGRLHDYSSRQWGGMLNDFYLARWKMFFEALEEGKTISQSDWFKWEENWSHSNTITKAAKENPVAVADELYQKYFAE